ncbi:peptide/nickel transport system permease protein [Nocardia transvalensis]|uniref:Peptide/nickel transport system permease protein n=1 Tax=Nocardia transvalensis TaxID=37333 RepID=A0A7W9P9P2_9NOCA|nr:ABC transporter permease [Nocardia transvalensis]MBB5912086.1 peptide/nickel transport system permease protein [Nocardia transvalensis]
MTARIAWRVAALVPILFVISVATFTIGVLSPGDPVRSGLGQQLSPESIAALRAAYGLDDPLPQRYWDWLTGLFTDGGGQSLVQHTGVLSMLGPAFANTIVLAAAAIVVSVGFGAIIGAVAALNHNRLVDRLVMGLVQIGSNLSVYWFGLILIWLFAIRLHTLPASGKRNYRVEDPGLGDLLNHLVLPAVSAGLISMLVLARFARVAVIDALASDYVRTLRSQGLPRHRIVLRHIGRNVAPTLLNATGLEIGALLSGVVFVESVYNWPGLGVQLVAAISGHDYPVIQAGVLLVTVTFVVVNLATDIGRDLLDPRLRRAQ